VLAAYGLSGLLCAIAAIMNASYELNVNAGFGSDWLLPSFIAAVLGGVALTGGEVSVVGILLAALFYDSLQSGLTIINVPSYWIELPQGCVLLAAVLLDQLRRRRARPRERLPPAEPEAVSP
jgi:ribose transport system permease protein